MKHLSNPYRLASILLAIPLLAGCARAVTQTPTPEGIEDRVATSVAMTMVAQGEVATFVAMTVAAQNTQTAAAIPSPTNTASVFEPVIITTDTPPVPDTPSPTPVIDEPTPIATVTPKLYACDAFTQSPEYYEKIKPGEKFDIKWIIVNTGTKAWRAGIDVKYSSGPQMTTATSVEIPNALQPGESYTIVLDAVAPKKQGMQYMTWIVEGQLCYPNIAIDVTK